jgi:hypothetical protein
MINKSSALFSSISIFFRYFSEYFKHNLSFVTDKMSDDIVNNHTNGKGLEWVDIQSLVPPQNQTLTHSTFLDGTSMITDIAFI